MFFFQLSTFEERQKHPDNHLRSKIPPRQSNPGKRPSTTIVPEGKTPKPLNLFQPQVDEMEDIQRQNREQLQIISELRQLALVNLGFLFVIFLYQKAS